MMFLRTASRTAALLQVTTKIPCRIYCHKRRSSWQQTAQCLELGTCFSKTTFCTVPVAPWQLTARSFATKSRKGRTKRKAPVAYSDTSDSESEFSSDDFEATEKATTSPLPMVAELPSIRKTLQMFELRAEKQLGQHFIVDHLITDKLARNMGDLSQCVVMEIGAGPGTLTRSLLNAGAKRVVAIELDKRFAPALQMLQEAVGDDRLRLCFTDVLQHDWSVGLEDVTPMAWDAAMSPVKVVGNLPYSISTELVLRFLRDMDARRGVFSYGRAELYFVMQLEVVQKLRALPGASDRGRLSILAQRLARVKQLYTLSESMFLPKPKVKSAQVAFIPHVDPHVLVAMETAESLLMRMEGTHRNKQLKNGLGCACACVSYTKPRSIFAGLDKQAREDFVKDILEHTGADGTKRLHQLDPPVIEGLMAKLVEVTARPEFRGSATDKS